MQERLAEDAASATTMAGVRFVARLLLFTSSIILGIAALQIAYAVWQRRKGTLA